MQVSIYILSPRGHVEAAVLERLYLPPHLFRIAHVLHTVLHSHRLQETGNANTPNAAWREGGGGGYVGRPEGYGVQDGKGGGSIYIFKRNTTTKPRVLKKRSFVSTYRKECWTTKWAAVGCRPNNRVLCYCCRSVVRPIHIVGSGWMPTQQRVLGCCCCIFLISTHQ